MKEISATSLEIPAAIILNSKPFDANDKKIPKNERIISNKFGETAR